MRRGEGSEEILDRGVDKDVAALGVIPGEVRLPLKLALGGHRTCDGPLHRQPVAVLGRLELLKNRRMRGVRSAKLSEVVQVQALNPL